MYIWKLAWLQKCTFFKAKSTRILKCHLLRHLFESYSSCGREDSLLLQEMGGEESKLSSFSHHKSCHFDYWLRSLLLLLKKATPRVDLSGIQTYWTRLALNKKCTWHQRKKWTSAFTKQGQVYILMIFSRFLPIVGLPFSTLLTFAAWFGAHFLLSIPFVGGTGKIRSPWIILKIKGLINVARFLWPQREFLKEPLLSKATPSLIFQMVKVYCHILKRVL